MLGLNILGRTTKRLMVVLVVMMLLMAGTQQISAASAAYQAALAAGNDIYNSSNVMGYSSGKVLLKCGTSSVLANGQLSSDARWGVAPTPVPFVLKPATSSVARYVTLNSTSYYFEARPGGYVLKTNASATTGAIYAQITADRLTLSSTGTVLTVEPVVDTVVLSNERAKVTSVLTSTVLARYAPYTVLHASLMSAKNSAQGAQTLAVAQAATAAVVTAFNTAKGALPGGSVGVGTTDIASAKSGFDNAPSQQLSATTPNGRLSYSGAFPISAGSNWMPVYMQLQGVTGQTPFVLTFRCSDPKDVCVHFAPPATGPLTAMAYSVVFFGSGSVLPQLTVSSDSKKTVNLNEHALVVYNNATSHADCGGATAPARMPSGACTYKILFDPAAKKLTFFVCDTTGTAIQSGPAIQTLGPCSLSNWNVYLSAGPSIALTFSDIRAELLTPALALADSTGGLIRALTPQQLKALTPAQLAALTPAQLAALTPEQLAVLPLQAPAGYRVVRLDNQENFNTDLPAGALFIIQSILGYWKVIANPANGAWTRPVITTDINDATLFVNYDAGTFTTGPSSTNYIQIKPCTGSSSAPTGGMIFDGNATVQYLTPADWAARGGNRIFRCAQGGAISNPWGTYVGTNLAPTTNSANAMLANILFKPIVTTTYVNISLRDLVALVGADKIGVNLASIPDVKLTTLTSTLGMDGIRHLRGMLTVLNTQFNVVGTLSKDGLDMSGSLPQIEFGPLKITGLGADGVAGTADDGVGVAIIAKKDQQQFLISGNTDLFGLRSGIDLILGSDGVSFKVKREMTRGMEGWCAGSSFGSPVDFKLAVELENKFVEVTKEVSEYIAHQSDTAKSGIKSAIDAVESARSALKVIDDRIAELRRLIGSNDVRSNPFDLQLFGGYRDHHLLTYNKNPRFLYASFWDDLSNLATDTWNTTATIVSDGAGVIASEATNLANQAASEALRLAKELEATKTFRQIELGGCIVARETANGVLIGARETLKLALQGLDPITQAAYWVVETAAQYNIDSMEISIESLREFKNGKLPVVEVVVTFNGTQRHFHIAIDFKNIPAFSENLAANILTAIKDNVSF